MDMQANKENVSIVVVPFPAQGHMNQLLHLSIVLSGHGLTVCYAAPATHIYQAKSRIEGWHASAIDSIRFHELPIPPFASPAPNPNSSLFFPSDVEPLLNAFEHVRPHLADLLHSLSISSRRVVVISDKFVSFAASEAAALPNGESYNFQCVPPSIDLQWEGQDSRAGALLRSLGLSAPSTDDCLSEEFVAFITRSERPEYSGILINTCRLIEGEFLDFLMKQQPDFIGKKVFAIGPLNPTVISTDQTTRPRPRPRHHCLDWLDKQPPASVLYVSFGSTTSISDNQIQQLAIGLLNSEQKFIWVLREADRGDGLREDGWQKKLPAGFMERIDGKGIVIGDWAPQLEILSHKAIACFMSHCGWNSCMESISMGVPMLTWPMHSDQPWNSVLVSNYLKVGVIVRDWDRRKEVLLAEEIEKVIKQVMDSDSDSDSQSESDKGKEIKRRAKELGEAVRQAVADGGSSNAELISFINHITR